MKSVFVLKRYENRYLELGGWYKGGYLDDIKIYETENNIPLLSKGSKFHIKEMDKIIEICNVIVGSDGTITYYSEEGIDTDVSEDERELVLKSFEKRQKALEDEINERKEAIEKRREAMNKDYPVPTRKGVLEKLGCVFR